MRETEISCGVDVDLSNHLVLCMLSLRDLLVTPPDVMCGDSSIGGGMNR